MPAIVDVLSASEAAEQIGISAWLLRKLCRERKIPHRRLAGRIVLTADDVAEALERAKVEPREDR